MVHDTASGCLGQPEGGVPDATAQVDDGPSARRPYEHGCELHDGRPRREKATAVSELVGMRLAVHMLERVTTSEFDQCRLRILHHQSLPGPADTPDQMSLRLAQNQALLYAVAATAQI